MDIRGSVTPIRTDAGLKPLPRPQRLPLHGRLQRPQPGDFFGGLELAWGKDRVTNVVRLPIRFAMGLSAPQPDPLPTLTDAEVADLKRTIRPGDVLVCGAQGSFIHAVVYLGNGEIVHALAGEPLDRPQTVMDRVVGGLKGLIDWSSLSKTSKEQWQMMVSSLPRTTGRGIGVIHETIDSYFTRCPRDNVVALRNPQLTGADCRTMLAYVRHQVGKDYDYGFQTFDDKRFYCTELVGKSLLVGSHPARLATRQMPIGSVSREVVTTECLFDSPDLKPVWKSANYERSPFGKARPLTIEPPPNPGNTSLTEP